MSRQLPDLFLILPRPTLKTSRVLVVAAPSPAIEMIKSIPAPHALPALARPDLKGHFNSSANLIVVTGGAILFPSAPPVQ